MSTEEFRERRKYLRIVRPPYRAADRRTKGEFPDEKPPIPGDAVRPTNPHLLRQAIYDGIEPCYREPFLVRRTPVWP